MTELGRLLACACALALVAVLAATDTASANLPGANGPITYTYRLQDATGIQKRAVLAFADPVTGADTTADYQPPEQLDAIRPTLDGPWTVKDTPMFWHPDGVRFAMNSNQRTYFGNPSFQSYEHGAHLGSRDTLGVDFNAPLVHPDLVMGADLCKAYAEVVARLADGNLLWRRTDSRGPACNSSPTSRTFYVVTDAGGTVVRRIFDPGVGPTMAGTVFASSADPNVVYSAIEFGANAGVYRNDLTAQTSTRLTTTMPMHPTDVTPDGRYAVGLASSSTIRRLDLTTGATVDLVTAAQVATLQPLGDVGTQYLAQPVVSPDGSKVAFIRVNSTDAGGRDGIIVADIDGANPRVLRLVRPAEWIRTTSLAWAPAPGLAVAVTGGQLPGDLVELDLAVGNLLTTPITALRYDDSAHAPGLIFNTDVYSPDFRAAFTVLSGPVPTLVDRLEGGARAESQYLVGVDRPGNVQIRAQVAGTAATGGEVRQTATMYLVARNRDLSPGEEAITVAGGWAELQGAIDEDIEGAFTSATSALKAAIPKELTAAERAAARATTPTERELAQAAGLPDTALSWLPSDTPTAVKAYVAFVAAKAEARTKVIKGKLGSAYTFALETPWDYWTDQLPGGPSSAVPVGTALYDEGAYWAGVGGTGARGYASDAYALATDPKRQHEFKQAVAQSVADMDAKMKQIAKVAPGKARQLADQFAKDPVKGARQLGAVYGTIEGELSFVAAEVAFSPNKGAIVRGVKNVGGRLASFADDLGDMGRNLRGLRKVAKGDDTLVDAVRLGMPKADQTRWQAIVSQVQAHVKAKGYDVDLELSFRPRNVHSAALGDLGAGKNMFMKAKTGQEIDLLLGMDRSGLGKLVIYKPVRPKNFAKLPPAMRKELNERFADIEKARKEWLDPKSNLGRAKTGKGVTLKAELTNEKTGAKIGTTEIKMRIKGYETNGTISIKYLEHVVDGKVIVKPGRPKWVVSDYDGNAILRVGGKDLPSGAVRGLIEGEVMRLQRENGAAMATSFHGFTYNGTDLPGKYYRNNFHFLLEGMDGPQAKQALDRYLRKYATDQADYDALVNSYSYGDYVIHVTADAAFATRGL